MELTSVVLDAPISSYRGRQMSLGVANPRSSQRLEIENGGQR